ncbi:MAG: four helix bundle protein [Desulfobacterales bacterium]|nr:four helix bundle protein [Desulfobacterales bacterium]
MGNFQELKVWQKAKELAVFLYRLTGQGEFAKDWGLRDQIRRAAISIPSNIAEGDELDTDRQSIKFFYIAKGSSGELLTQAIIANEIGYLRKQHFDHIKKECRAISSMLMKLVQARSIKKEAQGVRRKVRGREA